MREESLWQNIVNSPRDNHIGERIDQAFREIEKDNEKLRKKLPSGQYSKEEVDQRRLGQLVDLIDTLQLGMGGIGARDIMGRVFEYFLGKFAIAEGQRGGQYYTPTSVVDLLVEIIEPYQGRIYDPCCGSGGMFVHSSRFVREHGGKTDDIVVYGQELTNTTWKLASMSLVTRGIGHDLGERAADTFFDDQHPGLKADYVLANPPFNIDDWGAEELAAKEKLWPYGPPTDSNANYAWIQFILRKLARGGRAGIVLAAGSLTDNNSGQKDVRKALLKAGVVEAIVALPDKLFHNTGLAPVLWILRQAEAPAPKEEDVCVLLVDARDKGRMVSRTLRVLSSEERSEIANTINAFRGEKDKGKYEDQPGFCYQATLVEIAEQDWALTPGRYVGVVEEEEDDEVFWERYRSLHQDLKKSLKESAKLEKKVLKELGEIGE
jgi:type I restriction enzyme M protein